VSNSRSTASVPALLEAAPYNVGVTRKSAQLARAAAGVPLVVVLATALGACGGGPKSPGVAGAGNSTSTTVAAGASNGGLSQTAFLAKLLAYTNCMRSHGIADFPDPSTGPNGQGGGFSISAGPGSDLNPQAPTFEAATKACQHLLPYGGKPPTPSAKQLAEETKFAGCVRQHGFPTFPDPNNEGVFVLHNFDLSSPKYHSVAQACRAAAHYSGPMAVNATNSGPHGPA
jgi:hypothetical protein